MYSKKLLGDRFKEIEAKRIAKILAHPNSHELRSKGAKATNELRKKNGTYKWKLAAPGRKSLNYLGRKPWSTGLTKETDERLKKISLNMKIHFDKPERQRFSKETTTFIKSRDIHCRQCFSLEDLVIHHIDMNQMNNSLNNLILLCRKCHNKLHLNFQHTRSRILTLKN